MRRWNGFFLATGLCLSVGAFEAKAQDVTAGDPAGFGKKGISNTFGYRLKSQRGAGYLTGLYRPFDNTTESVYYNPAFSGIHGAPSPEVAARGWRFSAPGTAAYRQGEPKAPRLLGRNRRED